MKTPPITVLMSVHNGGRWLRPAVESVLVQTWRDFQFLVIDDASTDDTAAQLESFRDPRLEILRQRENLGLTRSLNAGLRAARGELIARQDADDISLPERLARQMAFLRAHPETPLVGAQGWLMDAEGRSRGARDLPTSPAGIRWFSLLDNPVMHSSAMFRRAQVCEEFGGYDETFPCCQDYELWVRIGERYPIYNLPDRLVRVREHDRSVSSTRQVEAREMVRRVVRRLVDLRLAAPLLEDAEIELLCRFRRALAPGEVPAFHHLLQRLDGAPAEGAPAKDPPAAPEPADLAATRAGVFARIAYNCITEDRPLALAELRRALQTSPAIARRLPWLRLAALFLLGSRARAVLDRLRA